MLLLVDTNVILDYLFGRQPQFNAADAVISLCRISYVKGYVAFHSINVKDFAASQIPAVTPAEMIDIKLIPNH